MIETLQETHLQLAWAQCWKRLSCAKWHQKHPLHIAAMNSHREPEREWLHRLQNIFKREDSRCTNKEPKTWLQRSSSSHVSDPDNEVGDSDDDGDDGGDDGGDYDDDDDDDDEDDDDGDYGDYDLDCDYDHDDDYDDGDEREMSTLPVLP